MTRLQSVVARPLRKNRAAEIRNPYKKSGHHRRRQFPLSRGASSSPRAYPAHSPRAFPSLSRLYSARFLRTEHRTHRFTLDTWRARARSPRSFSCAAAAPATISSSQQRSARSGAHTHETRSKYREPMTAAARIAGLIVIYEAEGCLLHRRRIRGPLGIFGLSPERFNEDVLSRAGAAQIGRD